MITDTERAWLAGFIDADGLIRLRKGQKNERGKCLIPLVCFYNTCAYTIKEIASMVGELCEFKVLVQKKRTKWKPLYAVEIGGIRRARPFLLEIEPYLITKKLEAQMVLDFCELRTQGYNLPYTEKEYLIFEGLRFLKETRHLRDYMPSADEILCEDIVRANAKALEAEETSARLSIESRKEWAKNLVSRYRWNKSASNSKQ